LGAVARGALPDLPSRHLGLVSATEAGVCLDRLAVALEPILSLGAMLEAADHADPIAPPGPAGEGARQTRRLGVARDEAFQFYYPDNLEALEDAGCELVEFSPLHDRCLPAGLHGLYLGGGYPEAHAASLAANAAMLEDLRRFAAAGGSIYAECGGLMYAARGIETLEGTRHPLLGLLPAWTRMHSSRQSLGYAEISLNRDSLWGRRGERLRGHEFHYSSLLEAPGWPTTYEVRYRRSDTVAREGFQSGRILASYVHLHFASRPSAVEFFVQGLGGAA
ncbi:MAG TPA: hypothetical protein VMG58_11820, partial [Candidatus Sulfotelmatobacter sp.]|nr:hypothetical protein [Candidatus Sulfotelmatobacter sp.]